MTIPSFCVTNVMFKRVKLKKRKIVSDKQITIKTKLI